MIRVVILTPHGRAGQGGMDRVASLLCDAVERKHGSTVSLRTIATRGAGGPVASIFRALGVCALIVLLRIRGECDVLHINLASGGSAFRKVIIASTAHLLGVPYLVHLHGGGFANFYARLSVAPRRIVGRMFRCATRVVTLGEQWRSFVTQDLGVRADRAVVARNAVPAIRAGDRDGVPRILFLGVLAEQKGVFDLLQALARIDSGIQWRAVLAGNGAIERVKADIARLGLEGCVDLPGWVSPTAVEQLLGQASILVHPSYVENLPLAVVEGMAASLAVVATPVGATAEIVIDGQTGLLVAPGDIDALARTLEKLLIDAELRGALGLAASRFHAGNLDLEPYAIQMVREWLTSAKEKM